MFTIDHSRDDTLRIRAESEAATIELGIQLARLLTAGSVVALIGNLGAGKTRLVQAIATEMGVPADQVNSPTFMLIQEYAGRLPLRHCDTYRLRNVEEFLDLGLDELFAEDGVALIEWADRVTDYLPRDRLRIELQIASPTTRVIELTSTGKTSREILNRLEQILRTKWGTEGTAARINP